MVIKAKDATNVRTWEPPALTPTQEALAAGHRALEQAYCEHVQTCRRCVQAEVSCPQERKLYKACDAAEERARAAGVPL